MNIRDLQYLVAVADHRHFGEAASACYVSQPALSMQLKKLETLLGVQLIERTSKSAMLTETGELITEQARHILSQVNSIKDIAKQATDPFSGECHLGIIPTLAPYLLPHLIPGLTKAFPKLTIYLVEEQTTRLKEKLRQGKLDAALLGLPLAENEFNSSALFNEEFILALPANHALSKQKNIRLSHLENNILLLLEDGHCMRDIALDVCHKANASESKGFRATSLETLRHMVAANAGITLMPKLAQQTNDGIMYRPFSEPKPVRTIGLVYRHSSAKKILLEKMALEIKRSLKKHPSVTVIN